MTNLFISNNNAQEPEELKDAFKSTWELAKYQEFDSARNFAIENGWRATPQRVQIRQVDGVYYIEPYEGECSCPNIIKPF